MGTLTGQRILVAGGTGTVGRYLVGALLDAGATVVVPSRSKDKIDELSSATDAAHRARLEGIVGDITDESQADRMRSLVGRIHGAIVSIGRWVPAEHVLDAPRSDLERAISNYALEHFSVAKVLLPLVEEARGAYVMITGSLSYEPDGPGTGLVAIAGATQSMLGRVLMKERADRGARINEIVIYSAFGRGNDDANEVKGEDVGRYACFLLSSQGKTVKGQAIHLRSRRDLDPISGG